MEPKFEKKFNLLGEASRRFGQHRSGWNFVVSCLQSLHSDSGIKLETFIEKKFVFGGEEGEAFKNFKAHDTPWIGIAHIPNNIPFIMDTNFTAEKYKDTNLWRSSFGNCVGLFATSKYLARDLGRMLKIDVDGFLHPTSLDCELFSIKKYTATDVKKVVQIGVYGRKTTSIFQLDINRLKHQKLVVGIRSPNAYLMLLTESYLYDIPLESGNVEILGYLTNGEYDKLLSESIALVDFYDSSANNAIIECMARATPIIAKRHAASIEYLGANYPMFFDHIDEVSDDFLDIDRVFMTHKYLLKRRNLISGEHFLDSIVNSRIYSRI